MNTRSTRVLYHIILLTGLIMFPGKIDCLNLPTHAFVTLKSASAWQSFDPEFYNALQSGNHLVWKYYLLGSFLPDIMDPPAQKGIAKALYALYKIRVNYSCEIDVSGGLYIPNELIQSIFGHIPYYELDELDSLQPIIIKFHPRLNVAGPQLYEMVLYAKNNLPNPEARALIYGAYMHLVEDYLGHMIIQPATAGYGFNILGFGNDTTYSDLDVFEQIAEAITPSWIPENMYRKFLHYLYSGDLRLTFEVSRFWRNTAFILDSRLDRIDTIITPSGTFYQYIHTTFQSLPADSLPALTGFIQAANTVQGTNGSVFAENLDFHRLRAYLHGAGILNFLLMGFGPGSGGTPQSMTLPGSMMKHKEWSFQQIYNHTKDVMMISISIGSCANTLLGLLDLPIFSILFGQINGAVLTAVLVTHPYFNLRVLQFLFDPIPGPNPFNIDDQIKGSIILPLQPFSANLKCLTDSTSGQWSQLITSSGGLNQIKNCAHNSNSRNAINRFIRQVQSWENHPTYWRLTQVETYGKLLHALVDSGFIRIYKDVVDSGPRSLNYTVVETVLVQDGNQPRYIIRRFPYWKYARKSGVLGGILGVTNAHTIPQPGVFRLDFERRVNQEPKIVYTKYQKSSKFYFEEDPNFNIEESLHVRYDLITFGRTKLYVVGTDGDTLTHRLFTRAQRYKGDLPVDVTSHLVSSGFPVRRDTLFWVIKTAEVNNWSVFHPMLSSDYRQPYQNRPEIHNNIFYQTFFKGGDPLRKMNENPRTNPRKFWPYMLPVEPRLNAPGNAHLQVDTSGIHLTWVDRSGVENRYRIWVKAVPWDQNTPYYFSKYSGGENTQSGFLAWDDPRWDQILPDGIMLKKLIVGVYAVRETTVAGRTLRFFSDVTPAGTLDLSAVTADTLRVDPVNGLRVVWGSFEHWASGVRLLLTMDNHEVHPEIGGTPGGQRWFSWRHPLWDSFPYLAPIAHAGIYVYRSLGSQGTKWLASEHPVRKTLRIIGRPGYGLPHTDCPNFDTVRLMVWPTGAGADGFDLQVYHPGTGDSSGGPPGAGLPIPQNASTVHFAYPISSGDTLEMKVRAYRFLGQQQRKGYSSWEYAGRAYGENALEGHPAYVDDRAWVVRSGLQRHVYLRDPQGCTPPVWVGQGFLVSVARVGDTLWVASQDTANAQITTSVWQNGRWVRVHRETHPRGGQLVVDATHRLYLYYRGSQGGARTLQPMVDVREPDGTWHTLTLPVYHHITGSAEFLSSTGIPLLLIPFTRDTMRNGVNERTLGVLRAVFSNGQYFTTDTLWKLEGTQQSLPILTEVHAADLHPGIALVVGNPNVPMSTGAWWFWSTSGNPTHLVAGGRHHCLVDEAAGYALVTCDHGNTPDPLMVFFFEPGSADPVQIRTVDNLGLTHMSVGARYLGIDPRTRRSRYRLTMRGLRQDSVSPPSARTSMHVYDLGVVEEVFNPTPFRADQGGREGIQLTSDSIRVGMWTLRIVPDNDNPGMKRLVLAEEGRNPMSILVAPDFLLASVIPSDSGLDIQIQVDNGKGGWIPLSFTFPLDGPSSVLAWEVLGQPHQERWLAHRDTIQGALYRRRDVGDTLRYTIPTSSFSGSVGFLFWGARQDTVAITAQGCPSTDTAITEPNMWRFKIVHLCASAPDTLRFTLTARRGPVELRRISLYGQGDVLAGNPAEPQRHPSGVKNPSPEIPDHFGWSRHLVSRKRTLRIAVPGPGNVHIRIFDMLGRQEFERRYAMTRGGWIQMNLGFLHNRGVHVIDVEWNGRRDRGRIFLP